MIFLLKNFNLDKIPRTPGLYFFIGKKDRLLYIGKAGNLRARLRSYFGTYASERTLRLIRESEKLRIQTTSSEIEALLEEAKLIKKTLPKYNILWRDDKNYFFVGITRETFPRISITHQPQKTQSYKLKAISYKYIGPFVSGRALKNTLRLLRQYFPYCTCKKPHARKCLSAHLGLCSGYCCEIGARPSEEEIRNYQRNIKNIELILSGKRKKLERELRSQIKTAIGQTDFEKAGLLKHHLQGLEKIFAHKGLLEQFPLPQKGLHPEVIFEALSSILGLEALQRIEMYDASMISGSNAVGGMVVARNGVIDKSSWRLFKIKTARPTDDPGMLAEVLRRRLSHPEWQFPDFIFVDGGKGQLNALRQVLEKTKISIPVGAISKPHSRASSLRGRGENYDTLLFGIPTKRISFTKLPEQVRLFLQRLRNETHRFTISFHRRRRGKTFSEN
ncbi:MAG: GIY-YIG nuclease family protein [Parcubacteria group bacterium]|nr:GIY-YIG nuclease family protein [Parcubacteria group bacterium]